MALRYNSFRSYLTDRFKGPVLKIPVNAGFSCPNRDGTLSTSGCTFCDNRAFSPVASVNKESALLRLRAAIARSNKRFNLFMPYLQPFSNTYGSVEHLQAVYEPLIKEPGVVGLSIGTRPDCFGKGVVEYLCELATRTFLAVELGLQSSHDATLVQINRGHSYADFVAAINNLNAAGIYTCCHVILGLPGETRDMMAETARRLARLPVQGVKIHQLMVVRGTEVEESYETGKIRVLDIEEYAGMCADFIRRLRPDQHVHRIMADSSLENGLIAPLWCGNKTASMAIISRRFEADTVHQGSDYSADFTSL